METGLEWAAGVRGQQGPIYVAVVQALEAAMRSGRLHAGDRLPPQRALAASLGVDLTTITRAYALAHSRGLIEATVGRGSFVRQLPDEADPVLVDLRMNLPPPPLDMSLSALLRNTADDILAASDASMLMAYSSGFGTAGQRVAGAQWLAPGLEAVSADRVLIAPGAQAALAATLAAVAQPGDKIVSEALVYPGLIDIAKRLGLTLIACPSDVDGLRTDALADLCERHRPAAVYVTPALHNPTTSTLPPTRRAALADLARKQGFWIIEDDPYSLLLGGHLSAVAAYAPDRTVHIATLAKTLTPGLRVAYLVAPARLIEALSDSLRALVVMPSPLMTAIATRWIQEGVAAELLEAVRAEAAARREIAARVLPAAVGARHSIHVWLPLRDGASAGRLKAAAAAQGLALLTDDAFAVGDAHPAGARISFGGPSQRSVLEKGLRALAGLIAA
jgi:DNA-binding transcriptional MocR family regulator